MIKLPYKYSYKRGGENVKRKLLITFILIIFSLINSSISIGASSTTYLYLDAIKIEDPNIEILSNELLINTTTSKIENTINLKNTSDKEINLDLAFPLENEQLGISIKDLVIKLNDVNKNIEDISNIAIFDFFNFKIVFIYSPYFILIS